MTGPGRNTTSPRAHDSTSPEPPFLHTMNLRDWPRGAPDSRIAAPQFIEVPHGTTSDELTLRQGARVAFIVVPLSQGELPPGSTRSDRDALQTNGPGTDEARCPRFLRPARCQDGLEKARRRFRRRIWTRHHPDPRHPSATALQRMGLLPELLLAARSQTRAFESPGRPARQAPKNHLRLPRVLPRLVTTRHGPVHVASGQTDRPRTSHPLCPGLPPRHSHRVAEGAARFQPTNREDRLTHGCWLSQFGFVSWSTYRQALYTPLMVELFAPRLHALARASSGARMRPSPSGSRPRGRACSPRRPRLHGRFQGPSAWL